MPRYPTFPYLFDESKSISTKKLKKWGYFEMNTWKKGDIIWSRNGVETGRIRIEAKMRENACCEIHLTYSYNKVSHNYCIALEYLPSNLGIGKIWYFNCPFTGVRCRKLHLINGKFMHRSALPKGMYSTQILSKKWRRIEKAYGCYFERDKHYEEIFRKHFKRSYNGQPTKRYMKLLEEIEKARRCNGKDLEQLLSK